MASVDPRMAHEREEPLMAALRAASRAESGAPIHSGIFVLANTLLGAGMLGLPAAFGQCGYVTGTVFILSFAVCACTGLHLLSEAADLVGRPSSFNRLANAAVWFVGMPLAPLWVPACALVGSYLLYTMATLVERGTELRDDTAGTI